MAEYSVNYIIKLLSDDSQLKKRLKANEQEITNLNAHERREVRKTLQAKIDALEATAKSANKNPTSISMIDMDNLQDELKFVKEVFKEMKELNPAEDWVKSGKMFVQSFANMHKQLSDLASSVETLKASVDELGDSFKGVGFDFTPTVDVKNATKQATRAIDGVGDVVVNRVHGVSKEVQKEFKTAQKFLTALDKVSAQKYNFKSSDAIQTRLQTLLSEYRSGKEGVYGATEENAALAAKEILNIVKWINAEEARAAKGLETNIMQVSTGISKRQLEEFENFVDGMVTYSKEAKQRYESELQKAFELDLADRLTKNLKSLNLSIELPKQADFVKKINTFVDKINTKNLHKIKVPMEELVEPKQKKNSKKTEEVVDDVLNAEQDAEDFIKKSGLAKLEAALDKMQERSKEKTTTWRNEMKKMLEFKEGDFQFHFGNSIMKNLQEYFAEPGHELEIFIDEDGLKQRIDNVIKAAGGVIGSASSTAAIDPKTMASAVYSAIKAAFTGQEMPSLDFGETVATTEAVEEATEAASESNKKYVKTLNESTIHIGNVIKSLTEFAKIAPNSKAGRVVDTWFNDHGIDLSLVRAGAVNEAEIREMIQESWLSADNMGHATGATLVDDIEQFFAHYKTLNPDKGAGKALSALSRDIRELFKMLGVSLETVAEWKDRTHNLTLYEDAAKYGRGVALLNKFRPKLHPGNKNKSGQWTRQPQKAMAEDATADDLSNIQVADIDEAIKYFKKQQELLLQREESLNAQINALKNNISVEQLRGSLNQTVKEREEAQAKELQLQEQLNSLTDDTQRVELTKELNDAIRNRERLQSQENSLKAQVSNKTNGVTVKKLERELKTVKSDFLYFDTKPLEDLKDARNQLGNSTVPEEIKAFQQVAAQFYDNSRRAFEYLNKKYGNFAGEIYIQGHKNPVEIKTPSDILKKIPEDAVVIDSKIYNDMGTSRVGDFEDKKSENKMLREQGKSAHQSDKEYEQEIRYKEITVQKFKPEEIDLIQPGVTEQRVDKQLADVNNEIAQVRARIENEQSNISELQKTKEKLESSISDLVGEDVFANVDTKKFKTLKGRKNDIFDIVVGANNALTQNQQFSASGTSQLNANETDLVKRLQLVLKNIYDDKAESHDLENRIAELEDTTKSLSEEEVKYWKATVKNRNDALARRRQAEDEIKEFQKQQKEGKLSSKIADDQIGQRRQQIENETKTINELGAILETKPKKFFDDLLFDRTDKNKQLAKYQAQKSEIDARIQQKSDSAQTIIEQLEESNKNNIAAATTEAQALSKQLLAIKEKLYADAEKYVATLTTSPNDETAKGKLQQTLLKLNRVTHLFADVQPFVQDVQLYNAQQTKNIEEWNKNYTNQELQKLNADLSALNEQLRAEKDTEKQNEIKRKIASKKSQITKRRKKTPDNITGAKRASLSQVDTQLNNTQADLTRDQNRLNVLEQQVNALSHDKGTANFLDQYKELIAKEKKLLDEIANLRQKGAKQSDIDVKVSEHAQTKNDIVELYKSNPSLAKKAYGLQHAKQYQLQLIGAYEQKRAIDNGVADLDKWSSQVKTYGLKAGYGERSYSRYKWGMIDAFEKSARAKLKEQLGLNDAKFQVEPALMSEEVYNLKQQLYDTLEVRTKAVVDKFKESIHINEKGMLEANEFVWDSKTDGAIVSEQIIRDIKQDILNDLATQKDMLLGKKELVDGSLVDTKRDRKKELEDTIKLLQEERDKALAYGGIEYGDLKNDDIIKEQIQYQKQIDELMKKKAQIEADKSKDDKAKQKELKPLNEEIQMLQSQILNREKLIELRAKEKEENQFTAEESQIYYTDKLIKSKERLKQVNGEIATLERAVQDTIAQYGKDSDEAVKAKYAYDNKVAQRKSILDVMAHANKKLGYLDNVVSQGETTNPSEVKQGGIFGGLVAAIKEGLSGLSGGTIDVDSSDIATETTLRAIFEMLSGGGQASADLDAEKARGKAERDAIRKESQARVIAEEKKIEQYQKKTERDGAIAQAKKLLSAEGQAKFDEINAAGNKAKKDLEKSTQKEILSAISKHIKNNLTGKDTNTVDYLKAQRELANMIFAYKDRLRADGIVSGTNKKGKTYLSLTDVFKREELTKLGDIKSLTITSVEDTAKSLMKLGYEAKLGLNRPKDPTELDIGPVVETAEDVSQKLIEKIGKALPIEDLRTIVGNVASDLFISTGDPSKKTNRFDFYEQNYDAIVAKSLEKASLIINNNLTTDNKVEEANVLHRYDNETLIKKFKHLMQLLSENKASETQKIELNQITDLLKGRGVYKGKSSQIATENEKQLEIEVAQTTEEDKQLKKEQAVTAETEKRIKMFSAWAKYKNDDGAKWDVVTGESTSKTAFMKKLRDSGYSVSFAATAEDWDVEAEKHNQQILKHRQSREIGAEIPKKADVKPVIEPGAVANEVQENVAETPAKVNITPSIVDLNSLSDDALTNKFFELQDLSNTNEITQSQLVEFQKVIELIIQRGLNVEDDDQDVDTDTEDGTDEERQALLNAINNVGANIVSDKTENSHSVAHNNQSPEQAQSTGGLLGIMRTELAKESTLQKVLIALGEIAKKNALTGIGKQNSAQDLLEQFRRMLESDAWEGRERVAYIDLATGSMSNSITGDNKAISSERLNILRAAYKDVMDLNAQVHTHANTEDPYFSKDDLSLFASDFADGIVKQILLSKNNMTVLDMTDVKDVSGLLDTLAKTEQNFEALATTADKFGAKYVSRAFNEITPQGLIKMLGIKGIESKYTEAETRDSAVQGILKEDAKVAADMIQESTGRAIKKTVERVGAELMTVTEKTDAKGNKIWSNQISDKYTKAALATNRAFNNLELNKEFGIGTDAQLALVDYTNKYEEFLRLIEEFKKNPNQDGLQARFDALLPELDAAEEKLNKLIVSKDKFLNGKEVVKIFDGASLANAGDSLKSLATDRYAKNGLALGDNIAFNGLAETTNGTRLLIDVLKNGTIQQYALEVDRTTGQVKELMVAENALANAFQNVNKAMRDNERVMASVAIGNTPEEQTAFMNEAHSFGLDAYRQSMTDMEKYVADIWNRMAQGGVSASKEELDYIMALSERVITLGKNVQKTSIDFKNFWAQNPDNVFGHTIYHQGYNRNDRVREELEGKARTYASARNAEYNFSSFDNDTLQFTLTDIEGKITKVTYAWNELYQQIAEISDKATSALDPMVAKINRYDEVLQQAKNDGYLMTDDSNFEAFYKATEGIQSLVSGVEQGLETFDTIKYKLYELRQEALKYGEQAKKTAAQNKRLFAGTGAKKQLDNQYNKIFGARQAGGEAFAETFSDDSKLFNAYNNAYQQLNKDYQKYVDAHQLNDPQIQKQIQQEASKIQILGKKYLSSITQAEKLQELVDQSGTYRDRKTGKEVALGGTGAVTTEELTNLEAKMRTFVQDGLKQANIETVKFDSVNQKLTYTFRTSKNTVADMVVQYNDATQALYAYQKQERESLTGFAGFMHSMQGKMKSILQYTASITSIYRVFGELKRGIQYIREIDSALTELKKVTDETTETYDTFLTTAAKTADQVGSTIKEVVSSTADWARLGYSLKDAATLAETTSVLLNVSEFQSIEDATSALTSTLQAFSMTASSSMRAVDVLNEVGNNFAISSDGIATALQDSASSLVAANNSYEEAVALIAAANRVVQDPNSVGAALRTISLRLRSTSTQELEEAGEDTDGAITSKSKLQSKIKGLTGIDILTDSGAYRSTYDILLDISKVWKEMSDVDQAALLEILAGKTRSNTAAAILSNTKDLEKAYEAALNAEGSALAENEKYLDSIQGRIDLFTNSVQTMWSNTLDSDVIKWFVDFGTTVVQVVDKLGLIPSILAVIGASKGLGFLLKGFDLTKLISNIAGLTMGTKVFTAATRQETMALMEQNIQMSLANSALVQHAVTMGLAQSSQVATMTTTQLLSLSFKTLLASVAGATKAIVAFLLTNPVGWMVLAAGAIAGLVVHLTKVIKSTEELQEELSDLKSSITSIETEIDSLNSELETTKQRIAELLALDTLSFTEDEELKRLQKQNAELEREIELQKLLKEGKQIEANKTFKDTMESMFDKQYVKDNSNGLVGTYTKEANLLDKFVGTDAVSGKEALKTNIDFYNQAVQHNNALKEEYIKAQEILNDESSSLTDKLLAKTQISIYEDNLEAVHGLETSITNQLQEYKDSIDGIEYGDDQEVNQYLDDVNNLLDRWTIAQNGDGAKSQAITRIFNKDEFTAVSDEIDSLVEKLKKNPTDKTIIEDIRKQCKLAEQDLLGVGLSVDQAVEHFTRFGSDAVYNTVAGKIQEIDEATKRLTSALGNVDTSSIESIKQSLTDSGWVSKDGDVLSDKIAEYFGGEDGGLSEKTRLEIERLVKQIYDGKITVADALKTFELFTVQSVVDIQIEDVTTNFKDIFVELEDVDGLINTFAELGEAISSTVGALEAFNQAQADVADKGFVSIQTAMQLMEYTDNYGSILEVVDGKLQLTTDAEQNLIQARIDAIKVSAQTAVADAQTAYDKAELAVQSYRAAMVEEASASTVATAWQKIVAVAAGIKNALDNIWTGESVSSLYNAGYNTYLQSATGYEIKYDDTGLQALEDALTDAGNKLIEAKDNAEIANALTPDGLENTYKSSDKSTKEEVKDDKFQDSMDYWENRIAASQARYEQVQNEIDLLEAKGKRASEGHYKKQIELEHERKTLLESQRTEAKKYLIELQNAGKKGTDEWWDAANVLNDIESELDDIVENVWGLYDSIAQLNKELSEETHSRFSDLLTDTGNVRDILSYEDMFDEEGNITEAGVATLGTHIQDISTYNASNAKIDEEMLSNGLINSDGTLRTWDEFSAANSKHLGVIDSTIDLAKEYDGNEEYFRSYGIKSAEEYKAFTDFLAKGITSEQEFYDEMTRLTDLRDDNTKGIKESEKAVVEMYENQIDAIEEYVNKSVDSYNDYINSVKEALDAERELYEFKKNVEKQTKNIAALERRISALSGSTAAEDIAERRKLEAELANAREDINNTYRDHAISSQQNALDEEAQAYEQAMNRYIDGLRATLKDASADLTTFVNTVAGNVVANADTVYDQYSETGIALDSALVKPWQDLKTEIEKFEGENGALGKMNSWTEENGSFDVFANNASEDLERPFENGTEAVDSFGQSVSEAMDTMYENIQTNVADSLKELNKLKTEVNKVKDTDVNPDVQSDKNKGQQPTANQHTVSRDYAMSDAEVMALQTILNTVFKAGLKVDGIYGSGTMAAVKNAQKLIGANADGYYGQDTRLQMISYIDDIIKATKNEGLDTTKYKNAKAQLPTSYYAKGTLGTNKNELAVVDELGPELILRANPETGRLDYLTRGTSVVPADISANLMEWGKLNPNMMSLPNVTPNMNIINNAINKPEFNLSVDNFLRCDNVSHDTLPDLKQFVKTEMNSLIKQMNYAIKGKGGR